MNEHIKTRRISAIGWFAAILLATFALMAFLGCTHQSDEEAIESSITSRLDGYRDAHSPEAINFASRMDIDSLAQYGINRDAFMEAYLDGFDYHIDDIAITDDEATASVTLICKSFSEYEAKLADATNAMKSDPAIAKMTTTELDKAFGTTILDTLNDVSVAPTETISIRFRKTDNVWEPTSNASDDIAAALMGN